jgi:hypothetical protein
MNNNVLEFFVKMKDMMSGGLVKLAATAKEKLGQVQNHIDTMVKKTSSGFGSLSNLLIGGGILSGLAGFTELVHEGTEKAHALHQAEAALANTMKNMGTYSKESFEEIVNGSEKLSSKIKFSQADIIDLQSQLRLVGNIGEDEMIRLTKASADMATKFHLGLNESGNAIAKAVNNPEMLRRLAMQLKIDPAAVEHLQNLAMHGKEAQARLELLTIVEQKVGGAAESAFNAEPLAKFHKMMERIELKAGDLAIKIQVKLGMALEWLINKFKSIYQWGKRNSDILETVGNVVGTVAIVWGIYTVAVEAAALATKIWAAATAVLDTVLAANPIVIIIGLIASLIIYFYRAQHKTESWGDSLKNLWSISKDVIGLLVTGFAQAFETIAYGMDYMWLKARKIKDETTHWLFVSSTDNYSSPYAAQLKALEDHHNALKSTRDGAMKGYRDDIASKWGLNAQLTMPSDTTVGAKGIKGGSSFGGSKDGGGKGGIAAGIAGGGPRVINIHIGKMVEKLDIHASGVDAGLADMERKVEEHFLRILNSGASVQGN